MKVLSRLLDPRRALMALAYRFAVPVFLDG
jgi:hypothetical protein